MKSEPIGPIEALKLAVSKEADSIKLYQRLNTDHPVAKDILLFLGNEEEKHKKMLEEKIRELTR